MEINKRLLIRILEEAESPPHDNFLWNIPHIATEFHNRDTGENICMKETSLLVYMCVEAGYIHEPNRDEETDQDLLPREHGLRLTLQGYEKLEQLRKEV